MSIVLKRSQANRTHLNFDDQDIPDLKRAIVKIFGNIKINERGAILDMIEFGGEEFIYYYEWDPCLLPTTDKGSCMLEELANSLGEITS